MVLTSFVALVAFNRAHADQKCQGTILAEDGSVSCVIEVNREEEIVQDATSAADIDACFASYCKSSTVRNLLVSSCKSGKYDHCDGLSYKDTYKSKSGQATYDFAGKIVYDNNAAKKSNQRTGSRFTEVFKNGNKHASDWTDFAHTVADTASYTWSSAHSGSVTASVTTSVEVDIPLVAKVSVKTGYSTTLNWEHGTSHTDSTTQTFGLTEHIVEEADSCTRACVLATQGSATVPYTMTGTFTGKLKTYESWADEEDAFVCCYLRPGGSGDCAVLGHATGRAGWGWSSNAGEAVKHGTCPGFGYSGTKATYKTTGTFKADMDFEADVVTSQGPYNNCPPESVCDHLVADPGEPQIV